MPPDGESSVRLPDLLSRRRARDSEALIVALHGLCSPLFTPIATVAYSKGPAQVRGVGCHGLSREHVECTAYGKISPPYGVYFRLNRYLSKLRS